MLSSHFRSERIHSIFQKWNSSSNVHWNRKQISYFHIIIIFRSFIHLGSCSIVGDTQSYTATIFIILFSSFFPHFLHVSFPSMAKNWRTKTEDWKLCFWLFCFLVTCLHVSKLSYACRNMPLALNQTICDFRMRWNTFFLSSRYGMFVVSVDLIGGWGRDSFIAYRIGMFRFLLCASHVMHKKKLQPWQNTGVKSEVGKLERKSVRTMFFLPNKFQSKQKQSQINQWTLCIHTTHTHCAYKQNLHITNNGKDLCHLRRLCRRLIWK